MRTAALLRGVNVGGARKLAMADLRAFLEGQGLRDVETLGVSGNAMFAGAADEAALGAAARDALGLDTEWLLRTGAELAAVVAANPFPSVAAERPATLHVLFHREPLTPALAAAVAHPGPERIAAVARELFIDYPEGAGRSRLGQALRRAGFPAIATARNWNTVVALAGMTG